MYYQHFGLKSAPFRITPDISLFFPGGNRGAVLEALGYAVRNGEGIIKVVGEVGSGKTMLCRMLEQELPDNVEIVYLVNPRLSPDNILHAIAFELQLPIGDEHNRLQVMQTLHEYLLERHAANRQVVVFVEEAQAMPLATLEEIRLLSNLETSQHKLLQIVLFGQPELDEMLAKPQLRQLRERITYHFSLGPLRYGEIRDYINARLHSCGYRGRPLFSAAALRQITRFSQGLLRRVNILADKALLAAYAGHRYRVGRREVMAAVRDSGFGLSWWQYGRPALLLVLLFAVAVLFLQQYSIHGGTVSGPEMAAGINAGPVAGDVPAGQAGSRDSSRPEDSAGTRDPAANGHAFSGKGEIAALSVPVPETAAFSTDGIVATDEAVLLMEQSLQRLPAEGDGPRAPAGGGCQQCTSIIYRPLTGVESL